MIKHYSPRSWLNSIYANENQNGPLFESIESKRTSRSMIRQVKGIYPSRSTDEIQRKTHAVKSKHLKRVEPQDEKAILRSSNQKIFNDVFSKINQDKRLFAKKQTEIVQSQQQIKKLIENVEIVNHQILERPIRKVKLSVDYPQKAQIVLAQDADHKTPQFTPSRGKLQGNDEDQKAQQPDRQIKSIKVVPVLTIPKNFKERSENLSTIQEQASEYNRVTSQSTFRTPREISQPQVVSIQEQAENITQEQEEQELLIGSYVSGSPIKNYQSSISVLNPETLLRTQQDEYVPRKLFLSGLKELYLEQQFEKFDEQNLTESIDRQLETGVRINNKFITSCNEITNSLDRLSPIPLDDTQKEYRTHNIHQFQSKDDHQESVKLKNQKQTQETEEVIQPVEVKQIKKLKILKKPEVTLSCSGYKSTQSIVHVQYNIPQQIKTQENYNFCSLKTYSTLNQMEMHPLGPVQNYQIFTDRVSSSSRLRRKGLSLSKKSQQKIKKTSLQRSQISSNNFSGLNKLTSGRKCKQLVRLGNKVLITLADSERSRSKPGIRVVSEQKQNSRIKSIKKKIL